MVHEVLQVVDECCLVISNRLYCQEYRKNQVVGLEAAQIVQEESVRQGQRTSSDH